MRDEIDGRLWVDHHHEFSEGVDWALLALGAGVRSSLARLAAWDGSSHQLLALVAAFAVTALTFNTATT